MLGNYWTSINFNLDIQLIEVRLQRIDVREAEHLDRAFEKKDRERENKRMVCLMRERERNFRMQFPHAGKEFSNPLFLSTRSLPPSGLVVHFNGLTKFVVC